MESESDPQSSYLVDLLEYFRKGFCGCIHYAVAIQPVWELGHIPKRTACKHIKKAIAFLGRMVQSLVSFRLTKKEREFAVKKILFDWATFERQCELKYNENTKPNS